MDYFVFSVTIIEIISKHFSVIEEMVSQAKRQIKNRANQSTSDRLQIVSKRFVYAQKKWFFQNYRAKFLPIVKTILDWLMGNDK